MSQDIKLAIGRALETYIAEKREEVIKAAIVDFEHQVRESVGRVSLAILDAYSVERLGTDLVIRVKITSETK